ncbi:MAG: sacsin N-terminal ATP-binding-like domain-containing protein [Pseudomonadota bacterium]
MTTASSPGAAQSSKFLADLIEKRRKLIDALDANKGEVNLDIFEDFYPDRAHFVYELLQNAEDAGATQVTFRLKQDRLVCEHDGRRAFTEADVTAITGIHNSTKEKALDRIGKFGVGFKSVFVYTQSPTVRSGEFSFRIVEMILPEPIAPDPTIGSRTRFELPFDNPKKPSEEAYEEIAAGLNDLDETTLLFLSNLQTIKWEIDNGGSGEVLRHVHSESHIEILKQTGGQSTASSHFLKFDQSVSGLSTHNVAVAFPLRFLAGVNEFDARKTLAEQMKIAPASQGRVAVFFTAAKETSGLLFHLHGPFVPELSRASIKETPANEPLFEQLATLCRQSLHKIKDLGLMTPDFLSILPNPQDQIPPRYQPIRRAIIDEMKSAPLTPTQDRGHAPANHLVQGKGSLKSLLSEKDLDFLIDHDAAPPLWAIGATQKNGRIDNFLDGLEIQEWSTDQFVNALERATTGWRSIKVAPYYVTGPDIEFMKWLEEKPSEWLQQFYALLQDETAQSGLLHRLKHLKIVRLGRGTFEVAAHCFFGNDQASDAMPTVDPLVYTSGKSKPQQEKAKKFLADLGVRDLGEAEEIELILKSRYTEEAEIPDDKTYLRDLKRFIALTEQQPAKATLFASFYIFLGDDDQWHTPGGIYLDQPYRPTDLSAYYGRLGEDAKCAGLHPSYKEYRIAPTRIRAFAEVTGARVDLKIEQQGCRYNPKWDHLRKVGGDRYTSPIDRDFYIPRLVELLKSPSLELSRLIWRTLVALPSHPDYLQATFQRSQRWGARYAESLLVHELSNAAWVPQGDGVFVRPTEAVTELLPVGFPYDAGYRGLKAVLFGVEAERKSAEARQKNTVATLAGFKDASALERAKRFADLPEEEQERFFAEREAAAKSAIPDRDLANPERRARVVAEQAENAPDKESEIRSRSVSVGREDVKTEAEQYLRQHYRNEDGEMTCQICKGPLPFKLDDGSDFFEAVEFLPGLKKRHFQNYLALCPNHSAMYRHANGCKEIIRDMLEDLTGNELEVVLAQRDITIYLSATHLIDIKALLSAEEKFAIEIEEESAA